MTSLHTGHDRHVLYLTSQISELTAEIGSILPDIPADTGIKTENEGWKIHYSQTGDRETVSATLQLLNELQNVTHVKLDAATLASTQLSLDLRDLGLREDVLEVQTTVVVLYRAGGDMYDAAGSLTTLSTCLSDLGRHEEALEMIQEAVSIYRTLAANRPDTSRSAT